MKLKVLNWLLIIDILTVLLILAIILIPSSIVRIVIGLPFLLFFPGYALVSALFPPKGADFADVGGIAEDNPDMPPQKNEEKGDRWDRTDSPQLRYEHRCDGFDWPGSELHALGNQIITGFAFDIRFHHYFISRSFDQAEEVA